MPTPTQSFLDKYHPDPRRRRVYDAADPNAYGPDGLLRDGVSIRVELADSAPPRPSEPMIITTNLPKELALKRFFFPDGTPKPARAASARKPVAQQKSAADIALDAAMNDQYSSHKPGYRFADADGTTNDARVESYNSYVAALQDEWKPEWRRAQDLRDAQRTDPPKPDDFVEHFPGEWQRKLATDELVADSNRPAPGRRWGDTDYAETPLKVKEGAQEPKGLLPLGAWVLGSQTEGASCSVGEGEKGVWRREGDFLYCRPLAQKAVTVPSSNPSSDAMPPRSMSAEDAQVIRDAAWREMVDFVSNQWKGEP